MGQCLFNRRYLGPISGPGEQEFLESGIFRVPMGIKKIEVFLVGGGAGGGGGRVQTDDESGWDGFWTRTGPGGPSGFIYHGTIDVVSREELVIEIGDGGTGGYGFAIGHVNSRGITVLSDWRYKFGDDGESTTIKRGSTILAQANGGIAETVLDHYPEPTEPYGESGAGPGGARYGYDYGPDVESDYWYSNEGEGGYNGSDGQNITEEIETYYPDDGETRRRTRIYYATKGTGLCTHLWRDPNEPEIFAGGGAAGTEFEAEGGTGGGGDSDNPGEPNTGGGGGGTCGYMYDDEGWTQQDTEDVKAEYMECLKGGCGYALIRWDPDLIK